MKKENIGSSLHDFLREEGIYEEVTATAIKRVLARQMNQDAILARSDRVACVVHKDRVNEHLGSSRG